MCVCVHVCMHMCVYKHRVISWEKVKVLVTQLCLTLWYATDCSLTCSFVHGILQARILEWVAISFSKGSSRPRDQIQVSHIVGRFFTIWATREAQSQALMFCYKAPVTLTSKNLPLTIFLKCPFFGAQKSHSLPCFSFQFHLGVHHLYTNVSWSSVVDSFLFSSHIIYFHGISSSYKLINL